MQDQKDWKLIQKISEEPLYLAWILGYDKVKHSIHEELIRSVWIPGDNSRMGHRGSYKSTCNVISCIWGLLFYPETTIGIVRKSWDEASKMTRQIATHFESNKQLRAAIYRGWGIKEIINKKKWSETRPVLITKKKVTQEHNVEPFGMNKFPTGSHYDLIIADDFVTLADRVYKNQREQTKVMLTELVNVINRGKFGIKYRGTPWHKNDGWTLCPKPIKYPVTLKFVDDMTDKILMKIKNKMSASQFAANYLLEHIEDSDSLYPDPNYVTEVPRLANLIAYLDPGWTDDGDHSALTIGGEYCGKIYIVHGSVWKKKIPQNYEIVQKICELYNVGTLYIEENDTRGLFTEKMQELGINARMDRADKNKTARIMHYVGNNWEDLIFSEYGCKIQYMQQIIEFTEYSQNDDHAPDSLAGFLKKLRGEPEGPEVYFSKLSR